jgi:Ca2+-binding EF-hand superfamily protein
MSRSAVEHQECPICCEPLASKQVVCLADSRRRRFECIHLYHKECQEAYQNSTQRKICACCKRNYDVLLPMPNPITHPREWFKFADQDRNGELSIREITEALKAILPVDWRTIDQNSQALWRIWDKDGSGSISIDEFCHETTGVLSYLKQEYGNARDQERRGPPPDIRSNTNDWFEYWDEDNSGSLDKDEVCRALIKTLHLNDSVTSIMNLRDSLDAIWGIFDSDNSGVIEMNEFVSSDRTQDSLSDMIIAQLNYL